MLSIGSPLSYTSFLLKIIFLINAISVFIFLLNQILFQSMYLSFGGANVYRNVLYTDNGF
jgi:hypothetical protein